MTLGIESDEGLFWCISRAAAGSNTYASLHLFDQVLFLSKVLIQVSMLVNVG
jgi:hypothetical protein